VQTLPLPDYTGGPVKWCGTGGATTHTRMTTSSIMLQLMRMALTGNLRRLTCGTYKVARDGDNLITTFQ